MLELKYEPFNLLHQKVKDLVLEEHDLEQLERNMIDIMVAHRGIGLAANQVGLDARVFAMGTDNIAGFCEPQLFINPYITKYSNETDLKIEGCLSFPGLFLKVRRSLWIEAVYQDTKGNIIETRVEGYMSNVFQHETDHLEGICYTNRISKLKLDMAMKKIAKRRS